MNKLDEIFDNYKEYLKDSDGEFSGYFLDKEDFKSAAIEFAQHILKEAAENANLESRLYSKSQGEIEKIETLGEEINLEGQLYLGINKESITNTINKYL
jgi:hypothetical protein